MITSPVHGCTARDVRFVVASDFDFQPVDSPFVFNVNAALIRDGTEFTVLCDGPGPIFVQITNGAGVSGLHIMRAGEEFGIPRIVVNTIIITYLLVDSSFRIIAS